MAEQFADLSHHQAGFDVAAYKAAGHRAVVLKATEGTGYTDPTFTSRWRAAGTAGLRRIAYHYSRTQFNGADEFDHLLAAVTAAGGLKAGDLLCQDVEDTTAGAGARAGANAREFTGRAVARGYPVGWVYTGVWYANPNRVTAGLLPAGWRRLWLSDYTASHTDAGMPVPAGWDRSQIVARQFTDRANVAGIGSCDYSRLIGSWDSTPTPPGGLHMDADVTKAFADLKAAIPTAADIAQATAVRLNPLGTDVHNVLTRVVALSGDEAALLAAISDAKTIVLNTIKALPTSAWTAEQIAGVAAAVAAGVSGLEVDEVVQALREDVVTRLSDSPA